MPRGRRLLTAEQEQQILAEVELRRRLSDKAIAARLGLGLRQLRRVLERLRWQDGGQRGNKSTS